MPSQQLTEHFQDKTVATEPASKRAQNSYDTMFNTRAYTPTEVMDSQSLQSTASLAFATFATAFTAAATASSKIAIILNWVALIIYLL